MILSFRCEETQALFESGSSRRWANVLNVATRKLAMLNAAVELRDLRSPPGNRLEQLHGDRAGQHSSLAAQAKIKSRERTRKGAQETEDDEPF